MSVKSVCVIRVHSVADVKLLRYSVISCDFVQHRKLSMLYTPTEMSASLS